MLVIGFSRGGTHLLWCFLGSHANLEIRPKEVNQMGSRRSLGLYKKLALELTSLSGLNVFRRDIASPKVVDKMVCSWPKDPIFRVMKRHDPTKYIEPMGFARSHRVFLVKNPHDQIESWMRRGCSLKVGIESYLYHLKNWKKEISRGGGISIVSYEQFCSDAVGVTENIWADAGLDPSEGSAEILWAPKAHAANTFLPSSQSDERRWILTDKHELAASLKVMTIKSVLKIPDYLVDSYKSFIEK